MHSVKGPGKEQRGRKLAPVMSHDAHAAVQLYGRAAATIGPSAIRTVTAAEGSHLLLAALHGLYTLPPLSLAVLEVAEHELPLISW